MPNGTNEPRDRENDEDTDDMDKRTRGQQRTNRTPRRRVSISTQVMKRPAAIRLSRREEKRGRIMVRCDLAQLDWRGAARRDQEDSPEDDDLETEVINALRK